MLQDTYMDHSIIKKLRIEAERTGSHSSRDGAGGYKVDLQWDSDALKVIMSKHLSPF